MNKIIIFLILLFISFASCKSKSQLCNEHLIKGNNFLIVSDFRNALKEFNKASIENPEDVSAIYGIGGIYLMQNDYEKALQYFNKSIRMKPNFMMAYMARASVEQVLDKRKEALEDYKKAIILKPNNLSAYMQVSNIEADFGNYQGAVDNIAKCIEIKPDYTKLYVYRGLYYYSLRDKDNACKDLNKAKELGDVIAQNYLETYCK
jgi:tetratricopeptide (TPR) repeat protein